jgi:hypothetical protein
MEPSGTGQDHQAPTPPTGESPPRCVDLTVDSERLVRNVLLVCLLANLAFFLLDCFVNYRGWIDISSIRRLFNTTREDGMASWFGVTQTLMVALTLWLVFVTVRQQPGSRWRQAGWLVLALFFTYMAIDDGSSLHERLGTAIENIQDSGSGDSWAAALLDVFPSYAWQVFLLPLFGALGLFMLFFLLERLHAARGASWLGGPHDQGLRHAVRGAAPFLEIPRGVPRDAGHDGSLDRLPAVLDPIHRGPARAFRETGACLAKGQPGSRDPGCRAGKEMSS